MTIIFEGAANLQRNLETVGGKLKLLPDKLVFKPHAINLQKKSLLITLSSISEINIGWTKLIGFIPLFPNAIVISIDENEQYRFTVFHRKKWLDKISNARIEFNS